MAMGHSDCFYVIIMSLAYLDSYNQYLRCQSCTYCQAIACAHSLRDNSAANPNSRFVIYLATQNNLKP